MRHPHAKTIRPLVSPAPLEHQVLFVQRPSGVFALAWRLLFSEYRDGIRKTEGRKHGGQEEWRQSGHGRRSQDPEARGEEDGLEAEGSGVEESQRDPRRRFERLSQPLGPKI